MQLNDGIISYWLPLVLISLMITLWLEYLLSFFHSC
uniref:Uncharacterized protein n=1 Tax=Rhizophora mucronata TaxID=61149 RepID=A0A2P2PWH1_RHIMU